jgi:hypothetical protein
MRSLLLAQSAGHVHGKEKLGAILLIGDQQEQPFVQANSVPDLSSTNSTQEYALDIDHQPRDLAIRSSNPSRRAPKPLVNGLEMLDAAPTGSPVPGGAH